MSLIDVNDAQGGNGMNKFRIWIYVSILITLGCSAFLAYRVYVAQRDFGAVMHRAQVAADARDMQSYLQNLEANMRTLGMTSGHTALVFKTPGNDLELLHQSVKRTIERLDAIVDMPQQEAAYQVALDDLRGIIRELEVPVIEFVWVRYWYLVAIITALWAPYVVYFMLRDMGFVGSFDDWVIRRRRQRGGPGVNLVR